MNLPLSSHAFQEFQQLSSMQSGLVLQSQFNDVSICPTKSGEYCAKSYYLMPFSHIQFDPIFKWIGTSSCTLKIKVFGWLLLIDKLNTRDMMQRKHWHVEDDTCVLCPCLSHENRAHLFFDCNFNLCVELFVNWLGIATKWFMDGHGKGC